MTENTAVAKFGGTSAGSAESMKRVVDILKGKNEKTFVVVSALGGVTNGLISIIDDIESGELINALQVYEGLYKRHLAVANELGLGENFESYLEERFHEFKQLLTALDILGEISPKSMDMIASFGESLSSAILYNAMKDSGLKVAYADPRQLISLDSNYGEGNVNHEISYRQIRDASRRLFKNYDYIITGGFYGSNEKGHIVTLGRGGSDFSAALIAAGLKAARLEIWTDVNGILTSDPKLVKEARLITNLSYIEASELAFFGAKVLHPKTIYPAVSKDIPVYVKNTFSPESPGTKIFGIRSGYTAIKAIAFRKGITVINVNSFKMLGTYGFLSKVFDIFNKYETPVDLVATSEVNVSMTIDDDMNLSGIIRELESFATVTAHTGKVILSAVGEGIRDTAGMAGKFFSALEGINITMVSIGSSEVNLSIVIAEEDLDYAVTELHKKFFSGKLDDKFFSEIEQKN